MGNPRRQSRKLRAIQPTHFRATDKARESEPNASKTGAKDGSTESKYTESGSDTPAIVEVPIYNLPPFPYACPKIAFTTLSHSSGAIMVGRTLASLVPPPITSRRLYDPPPQPRARIPGWTDGSLEWRDVLYNMRTPMSGERSVFWNGDTTARRAETGPPSIPEEYCSPDIPDSVLIREHLALFSRREERRISAYLPRDTGHQAIHLLQGTGTSSDKIQNRHPVGNRHDQGEKARDEPLAPSRLYTPREKKQLRSTSPIYSYTHNNLLLQPQFAPGRTVIMTDQRIQLCQCRYTKSASRRQKLWGGRKFILNMRLSSSGSHCLYLRHLALSHRIRFCGWY